MTNLDKLTGDKVIEVDDTADKVIDVITINLADKEIVVGEYIVTEIKNQFDLMRPVIQNPNCHDDIRKSVINLILNWTNNFVDRHTNNADKEVLKEYIYLKNPDFFPKESAFIKAKLNTKQKIEKIKPEIKKRLQGIKTEDRISGVVAADKLAEGVRMGLIDTPKDTKTANRLALKVRKRLAEKILDKRNYK